jgi:hypothetical protein
MILISSVTGQTAYLPIKERRIILFFDPHSILGGQNCNGAISPRGAIASMGISCPSQRAIGARAATLRATGDVKAAFSLRQPDRYQDAFPSGSDVES